MPRQPQAYKHAAGTMCQECRSKPATSTVIKQGKRIRRCGSCLRKLNWSKKTGNPD